MQKTSANDSSPTTAPPPATSQRIGGRGRVVLWTGGSLWIGRDAGLGDVHAHHAIQVSLALTGKVKFRSTEGPWTEYAGVIIPPDHPHQFDGAGQSVAQVFIEPETMQGRALLDRYAVSGLTSLSCETVDPLVQTLRAAYHEAATQDELRATGQAVAAQLADTPQARFGVDARVSRVIEYVHARKGAAVTLEEVARIAHLSPSRFRHLFMDQTGISLRAYLLWRRVGSAVGAAMAGVSWTEAALDSGFADSAHLTRTCRRMFGLAPTGLIREELPAVATRRPRA